MTKKKNKKYRKQYNFYKMNAEAFDFGDITEGEHVAPRPPTFEVSTFILEHQVTNVNETRNHRNRKRNDG